MKTEKYIFRDEEKKELRFQIYKLDEKDEADNETQNIDPSNIIDKTPKGKLIYDKRACDLLTVESIIKKIPEESSVSEIEFKKESPVSSTTFRIPITVMGDDRTFTKTLAKNHILVRNKNLNTLLDYIRAQVDYVERYEREKIKYNHIPLGFYEHEGKMIFLGEKTEIEKGVSSICTRQFGSFTKGDEAVYDEMINKYVLPDPELSLAYTLGFSAILYARLFEYTSAMVPIFGFIGSSSRGKTISEMLAVSIFANPSQQTGSLMLKTDSSQNGLLAQLGNISGLVLVIDDWGSTDSTLKISDMLYRLSNGTARSVSNSNGDIVRRGSWRGTILLSSETSLAEQIHKGGISARYIEFNDFTWTKSAEIADEIRTIISENYGWKGWKFGSAIANTDIKKIIDEYNKCVEEVKNLITTKDSISNRIADKYAIILLTIKLVNSFFNLNIDKDKVLKLLLENEEKNVKERNAPIEAYSFIYDYFSSHRSSFQIVLSNNTRYSARGTKYGEAVYRNGNTLYLKFLPYMLDSIMQENGFNQWKSYLKEWKAKGFLIHDAKRLTTTSKSLGRHYSLKFSSNDVDMDNSEVDNDQEESI